MKKSVKMATILVAGAALLGACNNSDMPGFKKTDNGLYYRIDKANPEGQQVKEGDVIVGEMTIRFDSTVIFSNMGKADRIAQATPNWEIKIGEGLTMLHLGESATFAMDADSAALYVNPSQMPPTYEPGKGQKLYYEISVQDIVTKSEIETEMANYDEAMAKRQASEADDIAAYVKENNITVKPTNEGLYIIIKKRGNGSKVVVGSQVKVNYTGRLLDGTIFDSSVESDARTGNIYTPQRPYEPIELVAGKHMVIEGWEQGLLGQTAGTQMQLIIPSALAYGPKRAGKLILPYSPLVFDMEIVSVN